MKFVGFISTVEDCAPLAIVIALTSVTAPVPPKVALGSVFPKVRIAPEVSPLVLKSSVPLLVRFPPIVRLLFVTVPVVGDWRFPPLSIVTFKAAAVVVSTVTVQPEPMETLSKAVGTTPPVQVAVSLQNGQLKNPQRDLVLGAITRNSGGHREYIVAQSALQGVLSIYGAAVANQYDVTYKRPDDSRPKVVQVGTVREGVQLHANGFAPQ